MTRLLPALVLLGIAPLLGGCPGDPTTCEARGLERVRWFEDRDRDTYGNLVSFVEDCEQPDGYVNDPTDCDDLRPTVYPGAPEICDGLDNNCNNAVDEGLPFNDYWLDEDGDTYGNPLLQVQACQQPPGAATRPGDCDDTSAEVNPAAIEVCDGIDNNCNDLIDDADAELDLSTASIWHPDGDGDGFGDMFTEVQACVAPPGHTTDASDCDDDDEVINPNNAEVCNGIDDDCDGLYDDSDPGLDTSTQTEWWPDLDADGFGVPGPSIFTCTTPWYYATNVDDCDDDDPFVQSAANTAWLEDLDGDGFGAGDASEPGCTPPEPTGWVSALRGEDCDDADPDVFPDAIEICNGIDDDCDELIDDDDLWFEEGGVSIDSMFPWFVDADLDGYGDPTQGFLACAQPPDLVPEGTDCDEANPDVNPGMTEVCNGIDDDCNNLVDDRDPGLDENTTEVWARDRDADGWGDLTTLIRACVAPAGYVATFGDCDDDDPFITLATTWWFDADGDGQGAGAIVGPASCDPPDATGWVPRYIDSLEDCDPDDPLAYSGPEICYDGIDQGCNGIDFVTAGNCQLDLPDTCALAQAWIPLLPAGQVIQGDLSNATNTLNPGATGCTGAQATGSEEILPVRVPAGATLHAQYRIPGGDGSIYLLASCFSTGNCLAGIDANSNNGSFENLFWTNSSDDEVIAYLVLDAFEPVDSRVFSLTLNLLP